MTFENIISFSTVETAILDLARKWYAEYLAEMERQLGLTAHHFPGLKSFVTANDWGHWPDEYLPCLLVMDVGQADAPVRKGRGIWDATRMYGASIICAGNSRQDTRFATHAYAAAFRAMILQHKSLERPDIIGGVTWVDERPAPTPRDSERTLGAINMYFTVDVNDVVNEGGVPPEPDPRPDPYEEPPIPGPIVLPGKSGLTITPREISE